MKPDYETFEQWFQENQRRFHCGHYTPEDIAYSAFLAGYELAKKETDEHDSQED